VSGAPLTWENVTFFEMENTRAIRTDDWKFVARHPDGPFELYDMRADARERFNLFGQPGTEAKRAELAGRLDKFFATYADPRFDRWKEGRDAAKLPKP
jgi:arylsulfatase A-like enzyme